MKQNTYFQDILSYFASMDIAKLRLYLKDEYTYEETTKEKFLNEVEKIFEAYRYSGDAELIIYKGVCAGSETCDNCGQKGYRFVGNNSKNYMDLLFEIEGDDIKDIYDCPYFKTDVEIEGLQTKADIYITLDERVTFIKPKGYNSKVYAATSAYSEIITSPPSQIDFEELSNWLDNHAYTNSLIGRFDVFEPRMKWTPFSMLYKDLSEARTYVSRNRFDIKQANSIIIHLKTEQELIDWLLEHEALFEAAPSDLMYCFKGDGNYYYKKRSNPIILIGEQFIQTINFLKFYQDNYYNLLEKYSTYTPEEESELYNKQKPGKEEVDIFSLRFHLEKRKLL